MQTTASDRDDHQPDTTPANPPSDDTALQALFELWRDLGGSD
jgi:hypothetical protein